MRDDPNFAAFVKSLETAPTSGLGKDAEYALWINSYNALAIRTVVENPCKKSFLGLKKSKITSIKGQHYSYYTIIGASVGGMYICALGSALIPLPAPFPLLLSRIAL